MVSVLKAKLARRAVRVGLVLAVAVLLLQAQTGTARAYAPAYSCSGSHCYAQTSWGRSTYGVWTNISVVPLGCGFFWCGFNLGFVDDETWLTTTQCYCWVEAGYSSFTPWFSEYTAYFWADQRPGSGYYEHDWGTVPGRDYGQNAHVVILANSPGTQQFNVWIWTDVGTLYYGLSTSNTMSANGITIGQELYGSSGASAAHSAFTFNAYATTWFTNGTFYGYFQSTDGSVSTGSPPYDSWVVHPASSGSGGNFSTWCC